MKFIIFIIIAIFLLGNFYVFKRFWILMPPSKIGQIILICFAIVAVLSMVVFFVAGEFLPIVISKFLYIVGTSWFFIFIYFLMLALLKDFIRILHITPPGTFSHYTRDNWTGLILAIGFVTMVMVCGYLKYTWKVRVEVPVKINKEIGHRNKLRVVAISDLHLGYSIGKSELLEWIDLINKEKPDVVLIAGDIIDNSVRPLIADSIGECFEKINSTYGVYACLGNHEYISGIDKSLKFINGTNIKLLKDASVLIDSCFYIVGRDDKMNPNRRSVQELTANFDRTKPIILLDHQPYNLEESEQNGIDLQVSGHTHRGQIWPISLITDCIYENSHGYIRKGNTNVYVSSGIGIWGGKFRIGTQSEYVVIDIETAEP